MQMRYVLKYFIAIVFIMLVFGGAWYLASQEPEVVIRSFEDCAAAGNVIMESYPEQCRTRDGRTFVRDIGNELEKMDLIQIENPRPGQAVPHQLAVTGQARGTWYFEASFPVRVEDTGGTVIAESFGEAQGEWMTENFVPFAASLSLPSSFSGPATLVLEKDNPSGLPEHADALRIPIVVE